MIVARIFNKVVFPAPLGPKIVKNCPEETFKFRSFSTFFLPKLLDRSVTVIIVSPLAMLKIELDLLFSLHYNIIFTMIDYRKIVRYKYFYFHVESNV